MKIINVMAVDDEILALNYIENLMEQEKSPYRLAAKTTNALEAIELFKQLKPTIVIADISMPDMNGITFMQRILKFGIPVRFIFLTAYREFQYIQEALSLGASGYLLKHDLNTEVLFHELDKASESLHIEFQSKSGKKYTQYESNGNFVQGIAVPDMCYPVLGNKEVILYIPPKEAIRCMNFTQYQMIDYVEIEDVKDNWFTLLVYVKNTYSYTALREEIKILGREIQQIFKEHAACTVSIGFSLTPCTKIQKETVFEKLGELVKQHFFYGTERLLYLSETEIKSCDHTITQAEADKLFSALYRGEEVEEQLNKIFSKIEGNMRSFDALVFMLTSGMNRIRGELHMPSLFEQYHMGVLNKDKWYDFASVKGWFLEQFRLLKNELSVCGQGDGASKARKAQLMIERKYAQDISVESAAEELGISGVYLIKIFKQHTGTTFTEYLTEYRMKIAKQLILEKRYKTYDLAQKVGYHSGQYFSTVFKKYTGCTPQEYRRKAKTHLGGRDDFETN